MITALRNASKGWLVKALLLLLVLSFGAWGLSDAGPMNFRSNAVITVGDRELSQVDVEYEIRREIDRLNPSFGNRLTVQNSSALGIPQAVVGRLINDNLLTGEARGLGIAVSDARVRDQVRSNPAFQGFIGGAGFDRTQFEQVIRNRGFTEDGYLARVREELARNQYLGPLERGLITPAPLTDAIFKYRHEERVGEALFLPFEQAETPPAPDEATLQAFHTDNAARFSAPETRAVTLLMMRSSDLSDPTSVTDQDVADAFEARKATFSVAEKRTLKQILVNDFAAAEQIAARLQAGDDFATVAAEDAGMTGDATELGTLTQDQVLSGLGEAAFSTPEGGYSDPVESALGWHVLHVTDVDEGRVATLADVQDELRESLAEEKAIDELYDLVNRVEDEVGNGASVAEAGASVGLTAVTIPELSQDGRDRAGNAVDDLPLLSQPILQAAFQTEQGLDSTVQELGDTAFFLLSVDGITAPAVRPFADVRDQVVRAWQDEQRQKAVEEIAQSAADRLRSGSEISILAQELAGDVTVTEPVKRTATAGILPRSVTNSLFDIAAPGGITTARGRDGFYVLRLRSIIEARPSTAPDALAAIENEVNIGLIDDLVTQLAQALSITEGVEINETAFAQILDPSLRPNLNHLQ